MQDLLQELKRINSKQEVLMKKISEWDVTSITSVREIKGYCELILELEVERQTLTRVAAKQAIA
jgi:hypothetical protein